MLEITEIATEKIKEHLAANSQTGPVRVAVMGGGCSGPSLGLALDEAKESDTVVELGGLQVIMDQTLLSECGKTKIDFKPPSGCGCGGGGFSVTSETPLPGSGGSCGGGSCSSGCSC